MKIIHILPINLSALKIYQELEMYLTHLVLKYPLKYAEEETHFTYKIVDNSFNEFQHSASLSEINCACNYIRASEFVLPDCLDPKCNTILIDNSLNEIYRNPYFKSLRRLSKMAVLHANTWEEAIAFINYFDNPDSRVDIIGIPKFITELAPFHKGRVLLAKLIKNKKVHFLGFNSFSELVGADLTNVRSLDTGWFFDHLYLPITHERQGHVIDLESVPQYPIALYKERADEVNYFIERWLIR